MAYGVSLSIRRSISRSLQAKTIFAPGLRCRISPATARPGYRCPPDPPPARIYRLVFMPQKIPPEAARLKKRF